MEDLGGTFIEGTAVKLEAGSADHVLQYFPWRIEGTGSFIDGGTWRLIDDTVRLLRPNGAAHFVTESRLTAEFLMENASKKGFRVAITPTKAGVAARGATGAGVKDFSSDMGVWLVNIYK